jgi:predicted ester cyclase
LVLFYFALLLFILLYFASFHFISFYSTLLYWKHSKPMSKRNQRNKQHFWDFWQNLSRVNQTDAQHTAADYLHDNFIWNGPHPLNRRQGLDAFIRDFWQPLQAAIPNVERRTDIMFGDTYNGADWVCATGYFSGSFAADWLGIPATGQQINIRFGDFWRFEGDKIIECYMLLDIPDVMRQAGYPVLANYGGAEGHVPGPLAQDGILLDEHDDSEGRASLNLVERMIHGLLSYDGQNLSSMGMVNFWQDDMLWYGPSGIGTARSLHEFEQYHQIPFLAAFPDRRGGDHKARLAEGRYVATTGWPSINATFSADYLGARATQQPITMRVMDWWKRDGDLLAENWVFIDLPDLMQQVGIDLFAKMHEQIAAQT